VKIDLIYFFSFVENTYENNRKESQSLIRQHNRNTYDLIKMIQILINKGK
jgi:hypothetical protein